jgi:Zn-dependent protease with chaperone function
MNFFEQQAQARQRTVWLVCGFVLGLVLVVFCLYEAVSWLLTTSSKPGHAPGAQIPLWFAGGAAGLILTGAFLGWRNNDGAELALAMGAREVPYATEDRAEIQYRQVVQEMAIAAGCAVPGIYVFDDQTINAYAAGAGPDTAVVAVSRGALTQMTRDELQAVVAHEFSHIFNGDMRLNMRMLGALGGLMSIGVIGQILWQAHRVKAAMFILCALLGAMLVVVGGIGLLLAQLIKSSVSRQREYLADASAIQFTRNPSALYSALRKVDRLGSGLVHVRESAELGSEELEWFERLPQLSSAPLPQEGGYKRAIYAQLMSHFFFAPAFDSAFDGWLATHPSLQDRLQAIDANGLLEFEYLQRSKSGQIRKAVRQDNSPPHFSDAAPIPLALPEAQASGPGTPAAELINTDIASALRERIPDYLKQRMEYAAGAAAVVQGLLLSAKPFVRQAQRDILIEHSNAVVAEAALQAQAHMMNLPQVLRLPFLNLAIPALRKLMPQEQEVFLKTVNFLVLADGKVNAFELMAQVLLQHNLRPESIVLAPATAAQHIRLTLSYLAYCGARGQAQAAHQSYQYALGKVPGLRLREMLPLQDCEPQAVRRSVLALAGLRPLEKQNFVAAVQACAMHDAVVHVSEWEIVRILCQCLEVHCPLAPPGLQVGAFIS